MQAFHYILRILLHAKGSNLLKVVSLGLGLTMSILLFARDGEGREAGLARDELRSRGRRHPGELP